MSEKSQGYPSVAEMQMMFPFYPCGGSHCKYKGKIDHAEKCGNSNCYLFKKWFSEEWNKIRRNAGIEVEEKEE